MGGEKEMLPTCSEYCYCPCTLGPPFSEFRVQGFYNLNKNSFTIPYSHECTIPTPESKLTRIPDQGERDIEREK